MDYLPRFTLGRNQHGDECIRAFSDMGNGFVKHLTFQGMSGRKVALLPFEGEEVPVFNMVCRFLKVDIESPSV